MLRCADGSSVRGVGTGGMGTGVAERGARAEGVHVAYAHTPARAHADAEGIMNAARHLPDQHQERRGAMFGAASAFSAARSRLDTPPETNSDAGKRCAKAPNGIERADCVADA
jgi:3-hydroxyacyl-CoA dehydrogenase